MCVGVSMHKKVHWLATGFEKFFLNACFFVTVDFLFDAVVRTTVFLQSVELLVFSPPLSSKATPQEHTSRVEQKTIDEESM